MAKQRTSLKSRTQPNASPSSIQLEFLGWSRPVLHSAVDALLQTYRRGAVWDLDRVLVVLPGSMAGRRLEMLLAQRAESENLVLRPPRVLTLGELPEELYQAKLPFADGLTQVMAWVQVLRGTPANELTPLLVEVPPQESLGPWMELGRILSQLHRELASDLVDFSDVADALSGTAEEPRWRVLARLQRGYLDVLHAAGLWDVQSARRYALEHNEVSPIEQQVVLLGVVDLNRAQRQFLAAIASKVRVLVGAPASYAEGFDSDGTLRSMFWQALEIDVPEARLHVRTTVREAAEELALQIALLDGKRNQRDVTIGVPDSNLVHSLQETLARSGVSLRYGPGVSIQQTPPLKTLAAIEDYLRQQDIDSFSSLIRGSMVHRFLDVGWLDKQSAEPSDGLPTNAMGLLEQIDQYLATTLLRSVNGPVYPEAMGREAFLWSVQTVDAWLAPLRGGARSLSDWSEPIRQVMATLVQGVELDTQSQDGNAISRGLSGLNHVIDRLSNVPGNLDVEAEFEEATAWVHEQLHGSLVPPPPQENAIEMIGWLDLALDDAPVLMLTGLHDGVVPESVNSDAFLPNRLRSELGLLDNARRYARDAYVMLNLLHSRESLEIILNRLSPSGDPQTPSRILMAIDSNRLARRVRHLISEPVGAPEPVVGWTPRPVQSNIPIPFVPEHRKIDSMAVTDFKSYYECPYRFYLRRVFHARPFGHLPLELDAGGFGDLVHKVLEGLMDSPVASSDRPKDLEAWLIAELDRLAELHHGVVLPPALVIQIEQARMRLRAFAEHQANHARLGWRIRYIEHKVDREHGIVWELPNGTMKIHGRIDRIDVHEESGAIAVLDYKTGNTTQIPRKNHLKSDGTWVDWQLPLYGQLISTLGIEDLSKVQFGYVLLPKNVQQTQFVYADFTLAEHAAAIASARKIASDVLEGIFWPPAQDIPIDFDDYAWITQRTVLRPYQPALESDVAKALSESQPSTEDETRATGLLVDTDTAADSIQQLSKPESQDVPRMVSIEPAHAGGTPPGEWFSPCMIRASAGTGKTYQLAARAIRLLFTDQPVDGILSTTFTRKAAGEILHRVLGWLADGCESPEGFKRLQDVLKPLEIHRQVVEYQLARLCSHLHRFRVSTLDSFYAQLAKSFALELRLPPGWSLIDPAQEASLQRDAITRMFDELESTQLRTLISQLSKGDAVRSVRAEIESVVENGYELYRNSKSDAWQTLVVPKAPESEDVAKAYEFLESTPMENEQRNKSMRTLLQLFQEQNWEKFLQHSMIEALLATEPMFNRKPIAPEFVARLRVLEQVAVAAVLRVRRVQTMAAYDALDIYHRHIAALKHSRRVVTFSDVAERLARWLAADGNGNASTETSGSSSVDFESVNHRLDCSIDHLLLDEFQDTSPVQWGIVKPFASAIVGKIQQGRQSASFFCVGDSKQAIYAWRGGVSEIFESVTQQLRNVSEQKLAESFRSSPVVIEFVNEVFPRLGRHPNYMGDDDNKRTSYDHPIVSQWLSRNFLIHSTRRDSLAGYVELQCIAANSSDREGEEESESPLLRTIADRVAELHQAAPDRTIGVLSRSNHHVAQMISMLRQRGVEASQEGGNPLIDTSAVLLMLSALQLGNHPGDTLAHFHVVHSPLASVWDKGTLDSREALSAAIREQIDLRGFGGSISRWVHALADACTQRDQERLQQFVEQAHQFDGFGRRDIQDFIEFVEKSRVAVPGGSPVRVMTIHASKGLEFDAVFLTHLDDKLDSQTPDFVVMQPDRTAEPIGVLRYLNRALQSRLPLPWQVAFKDALERQLGESLCLFYVALTRARQALYLFTTPSKNPVKTWGSALQSAFSEGADGVPAGTILYQKGDPEWYRSVSNESSSDAAEGSKDEDIRRIPSKRIAFADFSGAVLEGLAPSQKPRERVQALTELLEQQDHGGVIIGKLVHRWFEEIHGWIEAFQPNRGSLEAIARALLTPEEMAQFKLKEWIDRFVGYCESPSLRELLSAERYRAWHIPQPLRLEVTTERRLLQIVDRHLVRGVIDRCVLGYEGDRVVRAEIIDYKTDQRANNEPLDVWLGGRIARHQSQLFNYRRVLCRQFGLHPSAVAMTLVFPSEERIETLAETG